MEKMGSQTQKSEWEGMGCLFFIIAIMVIGGWLYDDFRKNNSDSFYIDNRNAIAIFTEAKNPLGSIFNKDVMILTDDNLIIERQSVFGKKTTTYPYNTLKGVMFTKSIIGYKFAIKYPGSYFGDDTSTFYFNKKDTVINLISQFRIKSNNRCIISESLGEK
jgi:hypothetical protein